MLSRCRYDSMARYYRDRGVTVCERWRTFENFLADMGERPRGTTLDRIDGRKGYEPGNCRWATPAQQSQNRRSSRLTEAQAIEVLGRREHGESQSSIARRMGVSQTTVFDIEHGRSWPQLERA